MGKGIDMSNISYREMLQRAQEQLPRKLEKYDRFEVPRPKVIKVGKKTVIQNFGEISDALIRDPKHLLKFLTGEMATLATIDGGRAIFQGVFKEDTIRNLIDTYVERYVICPVCKRPDTRIVREKRISFLVCEACGARSSISLKV